MALRTHLKIALAWLRYQEQDTVLRLTTTAKLPMSPIALTDVADVILNALGVHIGSNEAFEVPDGESPYHHYFSWRLAVVTEAILELEELLDE